MTEDPVPVVDRQQQQRAAIWRRLGHYCCRYPYPYCYPYPYPYP